MQSHNLGQGWIANLMDDGAMVIQNVNSNEYHNLSAQSVERLRTIMRNDDTFQSHLADTDEVVTVHINPDGTFSI